MAERQARDERYYQKHREQILARKRKYYRANPDKVISIRRRHYEKYTGQFVDYKVECGCAVCGERCGAVLDFHHVGAKRHAVNDLIKTHQAAEVVWSEIGRCVVLCANCHRKFHAGLISL